MTRPVTGDKLKPRRWRLGCAALIALPFVMLAWSLIEPHLLLVREVTVSSPELPAAFDGFRIAELCDFHHGPDVSLAHIEAAVAKSNSLHPDLVVITGDFASGAPTMIKPLVPVLKRLQSRRGVYAVMGNHDHVWYQGEWVRAALAAAGIADLDNAGVWIEAPSPGAGESSATKERIRLGGVDDLWMAKQDLAAALGESGPHDFVILLAHNPDYANLVPTERIDLMLSGHTHGGQITLFGLYAPILPIASGQRFRSGTIKLGTMTLIVSRGIGLISPPLRFCCPPEIVSITLRRRAEE